MRSTLKIALALSALLGGAHAQTALAQEGWMYPRVIENGENKDIDYGPNGPQGNIMGGGVARVIGSGENQDMVYEGPTQSQAPMYAHTVGTGQDVEVYYSQSPDRATALAEAGVLPFAPPAATAFAGMTEGDRG